MQLSICCVCCLFLEDAVHRDFKVLPKGFMSIVLESFLVLQNETCFLMALLKLQNLAVS